MKAFILSLLGILAVLGFFMLIIWLVVGMCGCAATIPCKKDALYWHNMPYDIKTMNCAKRVYGYSSALARSRVTYRVCHGWYKEPPNRHTWVDFFRDGKWHTVDVSADPREWGWEARYYPWLKADTYITHQFAEGGTNG